MIYLAGILVVLHGVLPHQHDSHKAKDKICFSSPEDADFFCMVKQVFLQDLGENHLENFQVTNGDLEDYSIITFFDWSKLQSYSLVDHYCIIVETRKKEDIPIISYGYYQGKCLSSGLRGPPHVA